MFVYRLEGPHPGHGLMTEGYTRNADSPISEDPDYAEESENGGETEHNNERGKVLVSIGLDKQTCERKSVNTLITISFSICFECSNEPSH